MSVKETLEVAQLRIRYAPVQLHKKVEKYAAMVLINEGRKLTKEDAAIELLTKATEHIPHD